MHCATQQVKRSFMDRITQARDIDLPPMQKLVLLALAIRADEYDRCWPSMDQITADTGCCRRTVIRAVKELEMAGHIEVARTLSGDGKCAVNRYKIAHPDSDRESPDTVTESHPVVSESHGGSVTESLKVATEVTKEVSNTREESAQFDYIKISKRLLDVAGSCVRQMAPSIQDISPILALLKRGASLEDHVLPAIRDVRDRDDDRIISSWAYFREPILARLERSQAALRELKRIELETSPNPPRSEPDPDYVPYPNEMPNPDGVPAAARNTTKRPEPVWEDRDDLSEVFEYAQAVKSQEEGSGDLDGSQQHPGTLHPLRMDGARMDGGSTRPC